MRRRFKAARSITSVTVPVLCGTAAMARDLAEVRVPGVRHPDDLNTGGMTVPGHEPGLSAAGGTG